MTMYLISFPSGAMVVADDERELVGRESHALVQQAKDAGVWVVGGGIELPSRDAALGWAARFAVSCRYPQEVWQFM